MTATELQLAIDSLHISDVYMNLCFANCIGDFDPKSYQGIEKLELQFKHAVTQSVVFETNADFKLLRVHIELGTRWVDKSSEDEINKIKAIIEAGFIAEYRIEKPIEQPSIDAFANQNASYHVWPYWREFLSSQCQRMHLPRLILPTMQLPQYPQSEPEIDSVKPVKSKAKAKVRKARKATH